VDAGRRRQSVELATRLSALRPKREKYFKANAAAFDRKVAEMMEQTSTTMNRTIGGGGAMVTLDRGFVPLGRRFGLEEVKFSSISAVAEGDYYARRLRQLARDAGAGVVFLNSETPAPMVRDWQSRLHMPVLTLDALGSSLPTGRNTYLAILRYNLSQLELAASRAKPTTATTRYLAETVDPAERQPPVVPPPPQPEYPTPPSPLGQDASGIKVAPIPNPYATIAQPPPPPAIATRPRVNRTPPQSPTDTTGIRVAPIGPRISADEPTSRPHGRPTTLPSFNNPFGP
jgi:hypothetical protein